MKLVVGLNSKPCPREEIFSLPSDFKLEKFKTKQKTQAFKLASTKSSSPKDIAYAFFA